MEKKCVVKDVIERHMIINGYNHLKSNENGCECPVTDLFICGGDYAVNCEMICKEVK